jgi:hypothetical protein
MPLRLSSPPQDTFYPPNDPATYRDLLMFEERLKSNAASLQRRKSRYQRSYSLPPTTIISFADLGPPRSASPQISLNHRFLAFRGLPSDLLPLTPLHLVHAQIN